MMNKQLMLNFEAGLAEAYSSCREYVQALAFQQGKPIKAIAADMDYSPSQFTRKLAQSPGDSARFTLDDLECFMTVTGDFSPIKFLAAKYMASATDREIEQLKEEIARLEQQKKIKAV